MVASIAKLPLAEKAARAVRKSRRQHRAGRRQVFAAAGIGAVASTLTALSLTHLAHGISIVTSAPAWESWAMAAGIDLGFVALEGAQLTSTSERLRREVTKYTKPAIIGTLTGSAVMNAFAFAAQNDLYDRIEAIHPLGIRFFNDRPWGLASGPALCRRGRRSAHTA
jgi:hypothetical protein